MSSDPDNEIEPFIVQAIRLVIDENSEVVYCSSMQKRKYLEWAKCNTTTRQIRLCFEVPSGKTVASNNAFTIEMDWGDTPFDGASGGGDLEPATDSEYAAFKTHMQTEIANILTPITEEEE